MLRLHGPRRAVISAVAAATAITIHDKPSIYPAPDPEIVLVETPSALEKQIGSVRRQVTGVYRDAHARVQSVVSQWIGIEHAVESRVKSFVDPTEPLTPGLLYVGIATLSGSIVARNRGLFIRSLLPPTLLLLSMNHFLPKTTANVSAYGGELEERYTPRLAQIHVTANAHTLMTWERIKDGTQESRERVGHAVESGVEWLQQSTGLKLREAFGWGEKVARQAESKAFEATQIETKVVEGVVALTQKADAEKESMATHTNDSSQKTQEKKLV